MDNIEGIIAAITLVTAPLWIPIGLWVAYAAFTNVVLGKTTQQAARDRDLKKATQREDIRRGEEAVRRVYKEGGRL